MEKLIQEFSANISEALDIAAKAKFVKPNQEIRNIVICGMGGSGIGGRIVAQWIQKYCSIPVLSVQEYSLPAFVNKHSLVIGSSYSGNTEETLHAVEDAKTKGATVIGICSGGLLEVFCKANNFQYVIVPGGNPPRTALAFSLVQLSNIFLQLGFAQETILNEILNGKNLIDSNEISIKSEAMRLAKELQKRTIAVYAGSEYEAITIRAKQQLNENSKELCWQHVIPEMNHNELVGWGGGDNRYACLFIQTGDLTMRNQIRFDISVERTKSKTDKVETIQAKGSTPVEKSIYLIHLIDWISLYLSDLKHGDPIEIDIIDYLKEELGKIK
ncbi:bifunctional phosphoglucose/phosphomannose isomerase [Fluviicola taffensis]|uniref:Bifunctional phosphoglucose/phosphomannose isomerase n=1 Tax=Fluviicola taffensis (strain DSM 16823 / NCIMB 13979 / RW262) TaxID=755732 RepID=F2IGM8_FLUTR|nr:bifunctional phosphoglucose/phosphomannose isomerase [Fluviicola taffensis]AEA43645.1 bifunctional phosphoglucose/phosphomannose isomerase [Fluviicola taffensis DSM 16823]